VVFQVNDQEPQETRRMEKIKRRRNMNLLHLERLEEVKRRREDQNRPQNCQK
jgi:hypothetical protein